MCIDWRHSNLYLDPRLFPHILTRYPTANMTSLFGCLIIILNLICLKPNCWSFSNLFIQSFAHKLMAKPFFTFSCQKKWSHFWLLSLISNIQSISKYLHNFSPDYCNNLVTSLTAFQPISQYRRWNGPIKT